MGRFRHGRGGRFLTAPEKTRQISKIRQIFYDNHGTAIHVLEYILLASTDCYFQAMPLLKIFSRQALRVSANALHPSLQKIWNVPADVLTVLVCPVHDVSGSEDLYIDVRAKAKPERTQEVVNQAMVDMKKLFDEHGYSANIRVELYEPSLQSALKP